MSGKADQGKQFSLRLDKEGSTSATEGGSIRAMPTAPKGTGDANLEALRHMNFTCSHTVPQRDF